MPIKIASFIAATPEQTWRLREDDISNSNFCGENVNIFTEKSLNFFPLCLINESTMCLGNGLAPSRRQAIT